MNLQNLLIKETIASNISVFQFYLLVNYLLPFNDQMNEIW